LNDMNKRIKIDAASDKELVS